jgi:hypothetical protein
LVCAEALVEPAETIPFASAAADPLGWLDVGELLRKPTTSTTEAARTHTAQLMAVSCQPKAR